MSPLETIRLEDQAPLQFDWRCADVSVTFFSAKTLVSMLQTF